MEQLTLQSVCSDVNWRSDGLYWCILTVVCPAVHSVMVSIVQEKQVVKWDMAVEELIRLPVMLTSDEAAI